MPALRPGGRQSHAAAAHARNSVPRAVRPRIFEISLKKFFAPPPPVQARQDQRCPRFQDRQRRTLKQIRQPHDHQILAPPNGHRKGSIRIKLYAKSRWPPLASQPCKSPLKQRAPTRHRRTEVSHHHSWRILCKGAACRALACRGVEIEAPLSGIPSRILQAFRQNAFFRPAPNLTSSKA